LKAKPVAYADGDIVAFMLALAQVSLNLPQRKCLSFLRFKLQSQPSSPTGTVCGGPNNKIQNDLRAVPDF
jgi:hypothetical protein